ncbi:hypothetical protein HRG_001100 [Hirsutella rhossiliensis]|uniref:Uncharacterized protein n=1 Tax=Hirsutella rhossiliensis TaxID=111463 RepID=A0A9P8N6C4_9HYPO|nr:uncharacterized protein HRG_01100 [Hirsutella rhossiliensis]KAH0968458.1 hypothetical protein HRG_01100 [Hirsutella rhossiliensis]
MSSEIPFITRNLTACFIRSRVRPQSDTTPSKRAARVKATAGLSQISLRGGKADASGPRPDATPVGSVPPLSPESQRLQDVQHEKMFYNKLVDHGIPPWYPVDWIDDVSSNPRRHRELLRYWQEGVSDTTEVIWQVYECQWVRWKEFVVFQTEKRREFPFRISDYTLWAKEILANRKFELSFAFDRVPKRQDRLTTWTEYLVFEYWCCREWLWYQDHDRQKQFEKAWHRLECSKVLGPDEFVDLISSKAYGQQLGAEIKQGREAEESARSAASFAEEAVSDSSRTACSACGHRKACRASLLNVAEQAYKATWTRNYIIRIVRHDTRYYWQAKRGAERHSFLLKWIRGQFPLIQQEMKQSRAATGSLGVGDEANPTPTSHGSATNASEAASKRPRDEKTPEERRSSKRQRRDSHSAKAKVEAVLGDYATAAAQDAGTAAEISKDGDRDQTRIEKLDKRGQRDKANRGSAINTSITRIVARLAAINITD